jgi:hypothetical protein
MAALKRKTKFKGGVEVEELTNGKKKVKFALEDDLPVEFEVDQDGNLASLPAGWHDTKIKLNADKLADEIEKLGLQRPKGFHIFSFSSPGCGYYWIGGRLIYRCIP